MSLINRLRPHFPWSVESGIRSTLLVLVCAGGLAVSWAGAHSRHVFDNQVPWLMAAIGLVMVSGYAHASHFIRARRALGLRRARLLNNGLLGIDPGAELSLVEGSPTAELEISHIDRVLVCDGRSLYHQPGCSMAQGRSGSLVPRQTAQLRMLAPCGICLPELAAAATARGDSA